MEIHFSNFTSSLGNKVILRLVVLELAFLLIFIVDAIFGPIGEVRELLNPNREANLPAWFSSIQLFMVGVVFLLMNYQGHGKYRLSPTFLLMIGVGFVLLSADEAASFHEEITALLKNITWVPRFKGNHGIWILLYGGVGLTLCLLTYQEILTLWRYYWYEGVILGSGFAILLLGAVGLEIIGYQFLRDGTAPLLYKLEVGLEEFLEMLGVSVILYGAILLAGRKEVVTGEDAPNILTARLNEAQV
jgi:hypothetical protein